MKLIKNLLFLFFSLCSAIAFAQTPGFNYQALILNNEVIQIPGTDVQENQIPLGLTDVTLQFTISDENGVEYIEQHTTTTDANGMISLIVGEGTPITNTFNDVNWNGLLKYLTVDVNISGASNGFTFLDKQKILYIPHPLTGTSRVFMAATIVDIEPPYTTGDLVWVKDYEDSTNPTLLIFDGENWVPVSKDYDPTNEFGLIVVANKADRDSLFDPAVLGDQVWNQDCGCIEVFDGTNWISVTGSNMKAVNGLNYTDNTVKLGGKLTEPTAIETSKDNTLALNGLEESTKTDDKVVVIEAETGIVRSKEPSTLIKKRQVVVTAANSQSKFTTPLPISNSEKVEVYRNGVLVEFSVVNSNTIELEPEAICYEGDNVRIVQLK